MLIFEFLLALKEPLVATFHQTRALTSQKYVVVLGMNVPKSSRKHNLNSKGKPVLTPATKFVSCTIRFLY